MEPALSEQGIGDPFHHGQAFNLFLKEGGFPAEVIKSLNDFLPVLVLHGHPVADELGGVLIDFRLVDDLVDNNAANGDLEILEPADEPLDDSF